MQQKLAWELRRINLQDWIYSVVKRFKEQARNQKPILRFKISGALPLFAFDRSSLELILIGLLNNACKWTAPGEKITVTARATSRNSRPEADPRARESERLWLQLSVSYCGAEIPASELLPVLDRFYPTSSAEPGGMSETGLGLVLVKKLIDKLGGTIWVESTSTQTSFIVELPQSY